MRFGGVLALAFGITACANERGSAPPPQPTPLQYGPPVNRTVPPSGMYTLSTFILSDTCAPGTHGPPPKDVFVIVSLNEHGKPRIEAPSFRLCREWENVQVTSGYSTEWFTGWGAVAVPDMSCQSYEQDVKYDLKEVTPSRIIVHIVEKHGDPSRCARPHVARCETVADAVYTLRQPQCEAACTQTPPYRTAPMTGCSCR